MSITSVGEPLSVEERMKMAIAENILSVDILLLSREVQGIYGAKFIDLVRLAFTEWAGSACQCNEKVFASLMKQKRFRMVTENGDVDEIIAGILILHKDHPDQLDICLSQPELRGRFKALGSAGYESMRKDAGSETSPKPVVNAPYDLTLIPSITEAYKRTEKKVVVRPQFPPKGMPLPPAGR